MYRIQEEQEFLSSSRLEEGSFRSKRRKPCEFRNEALEEVEWAKGVAMQLNEVWSLVGVWQRGGGFGTVRVVWCAPVQEGPDC